MEDTFLTIEKESEGFYKEKGSKFLAFAFPVNTEEEVKERVNHLKKKYFDARHHCYAYILGKEQANFKANDDGEPNHSAGDQILGQIRSNGLTDVLIVVVRYFGGTKLGVGGLINAYKTAAAQAILASNIVEKTTMVSMVVKFDYPATNEIMRLVKDYQLEIYRQEFEMECDIYFGVRSSLFQELKSKIKEIPHVRISRQPTDPPDSPSDSVH